MLSLLTPSRRVPASILTSPLAARAVFLAPAIAELVLLTIRFDTQSMTSSRTWGFEFLKGLPTLARLGVVALVIPALYLATRPGDSLIARLRSEGFPRRLASLLAGHVLGYVGFYLLCPVIFEANTRQMPAPALVAAAWLGCGLASGACLLALITPPSLWPTTIRSSLAPPLVVGAVGAVAVGLARLADALWGPLTAATFRGVRLVLGLIVPEVVCRPEAAVLGTPGFSVRIAPECSGFEGMGLIAALLGAYLWWARHDLRMGRALILIPLGIATAWLANVARIAALIWLGDRVSAGVALGGFHSQAGWLIFNVIALGIVAASQRIAWFHASTTTPAEATRGLSPTTAYLAPLMTILAVMMATGALSSGFDWGYPLRVLAVAPVLWVGRKAYGPIVGWSYGAAGIGVLVFVIWMLLEALGSRVSGTTSLPADLSHLPAWAAGLWVAARVVGSVVTVPIAEELAFRGYAARRLIAIDFASVPSTRFTWLSFLGSSVLFGVLHGRWLAGTLAGMLYAFAVYRRGRISDAILAHAVTNGLIAIAVLAGGAWTLWS